METVLRKISSRQVYFLYKVKYRSIMKVTTELEYTQEQRVTPLFENINKQQIYIWVRKHLYFCRVEDMTQIGSFVNQLKKQSSWIQAAP